MLFKHAISNEFLFGIATALIILMASGCVSTKRELEAPDGGTAYLQSDAERWDDRNWEAQDIGEIPEDWSE